jgi:hypothetical protein
MITRKLVNWASGAKRAVARINVAAVRLHGAALDRASDKAFAKHDDMVEKVAIVKALARDLGADANKQWHAAVKFEEEAHAEKVSLGLYV